MGESTPPTKRINHTGEVQTYMAKGLKESHARDMVAKDLTLQRTRRDIEREKEKSAEAQKLSEEAQKQSEEAQRLSLFDSLTGLPNHRAIFGNKKANPPLIGKLDEVFGYSQRYNEPFSVAILDLDYFKKYNDTYGHPAGNVALHELARVIRKVMRDEDFVVRYGGEEFAIILPNTDKQQAQKLIERLRLKVQNMPFEGSKGVINDSEAVLLKDQITITAGLTDYNMVRDSGISSPAELVGRADTLLLEAKQAGRNRVKC